MMTLTKLLENKDPGRSGLESLWRAIPGSRLWRLTTYVKSNGGPFIAVVVVFISLGISAIAVPAIARGSVGRFDRFAPDIRWCGALERLDKRTGASRVIWQVILGTVYVIGGAFFLTHPLLQLGTLVLLLSVIILAESTLDFIAYFRTRNESGSVWLLVNGLITLMLGGLISIHWPWNSAAAIGTLVGLNFLTTGSSRLMLGIAARIPATPVAE